MEGDEMDSNIYTTFKGWLVQTGKLGQNPDAVSYIWGINRFLSKRICSCDLFTIIRKREFNTLYALRRDKNFQRSAKNNTLFDNAIKLCFEYLKCSYDEYEQYESGRSFCMYSKKKVLFIHQGNIACLRFDHPVTDATAQIATDADEPIKVHASYCTKCHVTFIHKSYYRRLIKQFRFLVANFCELSDDGYTRLSKTTMAAESPLKLCGYSASYNALSDNQRHCLLRNIIYNGILTKTHIIQYLEHFITFNGSKENMFSAVNRWETDLDYVRNLDIESNPIVEISEIRSYRDR